MAPPARASARCAEQRRPPAPARPVSGTYARAGLKRRVPPRPGAAAKWCRACCCPPFCSTAAHGWRARAGSGAGGGSMRAGGLNLALGAAPLLRWAARGAVRYLHPRARRASKRGFGHVWRRSSSQAGAAAPVSGSNIRARHVPQDCPCDCVHPRTRVDAGAAPESGKIAHPVHAQKSVIISKT